MNVQTLHGLKKVWRSNRYGAFQAKGEEQPTEAASVSASEN